MSGSTKTSASKTSASKTHTTKTSRTHTPRQGRYDDELFDIFGGAIDIKSIKSQILKSVEDQGVCEHESSFREGDINICKGCGCEIDQLDFQPEWRYYGSTDNRVSKDPSRCHKSKEVQKGSIDKVFVDAKLSYLPQATKKKTEQKYKAIVKGETVRGKGRKAIVAACLLYVFRDEGDIRTSDDIRNMFSLTKQEMSEGLTRYHTEFPKDRTQHANPKDFIRRIMQQTKVDFCHYKYILKIANALDKVNPELNRSSPHSVASAIVYLYICMTPEVRMKTGMTKTKFAKDVGLSDITITKLVKISAEILGMKDIIT